MEADQTRDVSTAGFRRQGSSAPSLSELDRPLSAGCFQADEKAQGVNVRYSADAGHGVA